MKNIKYILFCCTLASCSLLKPKPKFDTLQIDDKYQLNYNLAANNERYQFIIDVIDLEPYFRFQFTMTNNNETSAIHTITPHAMEYGFAQKVKFGTEDETLKDHILAGTFSRKLFKELQENKKVVLVTDAASMSNTGIFYNDGYESYTYELNGKPQTIEVMRVIEETDNVPNNYLILNNPKQPIIIKMDIGWSIALKEINYVTN